MPDTYASLNFINSPHEEIAREGNVFYGGKLEKSSDAVRHHPGYVTVPRIKIVDVRSTDESRATLTEGGFTFIPFQSPDIAPTTPLHSIYAYLERVAAVIQQQTGAEKVICYDYKFRQNRAEKGEDEWNDRRSFDPPANEVHVDATTEGALKRLRRYLSAEEQKYLLEDTDANQRRIQIINSWQPCNSVVMDRPLVFCDWKSTKPQDYAEVQMHTARTVEGSLYHLRYHRDQKWFFLNEQTSEELALFLTYDSVPGNGPKCTFLCWPSSSN